jgi:endonuclease/exonuclease/phosphatase family metal-dependent hydrolase
MRITSWNLLHGMEIPPNPAGPSTPALRRAIAEIESDLIAVQEVDYRLPRTHLANQIAQIAAAMSATDWAFAPSVIGTPGEKWHKPNASDPRYISNNSIGELAGSYGIAIASNIPVIKWQRLDLGRSIIGLPLIVPTESETSSRPKLRAIYVHDEPRVALAATLQNGITVINTHLSFAPGVNLAQLRKLKKWADQIAHESNTIPIILGDLNLPKGIPVIGSKWKSLVTQNTYPSWGAKIQFDYILADNLSGYEVIDRKTVKTGLSDHLPLRIELIGPRK